jgi:hypothetical protein
VDSLSHLFTMAHTRCWTATGSSSSLKSVARSNPLVWTNSSHTEESSLYYPTSHPREVGLSSCFFSPQPGCLRTGGAGYVAAKMRHLSPKKIRQLSRVKMRQ